MNGHEVALDTDLLSLSSMSAVVPIAFANHFWKSESVFY